MGIEELKNHLWDLRKNYHKKNYHKIVQDLIQKAVTEGNIT